MSATAGSLSAVGIGIRAPAHATPEARRNIERADKLFSIIVDPVADYWLRALNATTESLGRFYAEGKGRAESYEEMVECVLEPVRRGLRVCIASYGHPGVTAYPLHEAVRRARAEGYAAEMLPGISAEDCLYADLGIDPSVSGCRSFEATDFLVYRRPADPMSDLILWQVGGIGVQDARNERDAWNREGIAILAERLLEAYRPDHEVVVYEASRLPMCPSTIDRVALESLPQTRVSAIATLYVPAMTKPAVDEAMVRRLGIRRTSKASAAASS